MYKMNARRNSLAVPTSAAIKAQLNTKADIQKHLSALAFAAVVVVGSATPALALLQDAPSVSDSGQTTSVPPQASPVEKSPAEARTREQLLERRFLVNFFDDQKDIWTSPRRLEKRDLFWLVPAAALTGEMIHRDAYLYRRLTPSMYPGATSKTFSDAGVVAFAGGVAGMYLVGRWHDNDHQRETAVLATEALADSMAVVYPLKYALGRERPFNGTGQGDFFATGGGTAFPSGHAIAAWSMASVIAHEYPGPLTKLGVYGLATAISIARVTGRQHFPTDVVVGSALGWGIGTMTYRHHHDESLPGADIGDFHKSHDENRSSSIGSPIVSLDSWIYPALDRLFSLGYAPSAFENMRPWTQNECLRLMDEVDGLIDNQDDSGTATEAREIVTRVRHELEAQDGSSKIRLESVYARVTGISGSPLTDGYHFGQTMYNDYGRPFGEGTSAITGISGWATSGRFTAYLQTEYQHAPGGPALPDAARIAISDSATGDATPLQPATPVPEVNRVRLLDAYVAMNIADWQLSFGKQTLWWGPGQDGALNLSNNAEPITMVRLARVKPFVIPHVFSWMGPIKAEFFLGRLSGQQFVRTDHALFTPPIHPQPLIDGMKLGFKPTPNLEFGFSVTTIFGGPGFPVTATSFIRTFTFANAFPGAADDPGDRRSGFDFSYRIPKLRKWLMLYSDSFTEDEFSPIAYPRRSAFRSGIYVPHLPRLPKTDFRVEGVYTDLPNLRGAGVYYFNTRYLSGFTNDGNIMGDWIGREGQGVNAETNYWFAPDKKITLSYRTQTVNPDFLQGGHLQDFGGQSTWAVGHDLQISGGITYEHWNYPILGPPRSNLATSVQLRFTPPQHWR